MNILQRLLALAFLRSVRRKIVQEKPKESVKESLDYVLSRLLEIKQSMAGTNTKSEPLTEHEFLAQNGCASIAEFVLYNCGFAASAVCVWCYDCTYMDTRTLKEMAPHLAQCDKAPEQTRSLCREFIGVPDLTTRRKRMARV